MPRHSSAAEPRIRKAIRGVIVPETTFAAAAVADALPVVGTTEEIAEVVNREQIDYAVIMNRSLPHSEVERCERIFWRMSVPVSYVLDLPHDVKWGGEALRFQ